MCPLTRWVAGFVGGLVWTASLSGCVAPPGRVEHVVIVWLMQPDDPEARRRVIEATRSLADIPGVESIRVGSVLASERSVVDSTYDLGIAMTFRDRAALEAYQTHPRHQAAVREVLQPHAARIRVYDFAHE